MNQDVLYISFFEMLGREGYLRFASTLNSSFPFSQLYHGRDISIISVLSARWTFRHDRKSCLTTRRKKKRGTYIPLGSEAPWRLIRNGRWYRVENFPSNINADGVSADENQARLMREKNAVMKGDYRENRIEIPLSFPFPSLFASCPRRSFPLLNREAGDSEWSWGPAWERKKKESDLRIKYVGGMVPLVRPWIGWHRSFGHKGGKENCPFAEW